MSGTSSIRLGVAIALICFEAVAQSGGQADPIRIETGSLELVIGSNGTNLHFVDPRDEQDYCDQEAAPAFASVTKEGTQFPASAVAFEDGMLSVAFGESGVSAGIRVSVHPAYFTLEVVSVEGDAEALTFIDTQLKLTGTLKDEFAATILALNLQTNVTTIPGPDKRLTATCYEQFEMVGAKVAVVAGPLSELRDAMKEVVRKADELPQTSIGGPFALDAEISRGSYLFDFGQLTEETVDDWVQFVQRLGLRQVDFHCGRSLRFGDYAPDPKLFPRGRASVKAVIDKLHEAGIAAGLHTYAFFIAKSTPYVTPVPDPRLGKFATFTLSAPLGLESDTVPVEESTADMSTTTGFFERNSVTLHIDDELITFTGFSKQPPFAFTGCKRGACGTTVAEHAQGAKAHHLKECFGLFTPDADSTLLAEVAANTADTFNECGFDMMYLDALDGEDILAGRENSWHYGSKFVFEIANRLEKSALFEMSTFHHHLWYVRARMGAWDHPSRSHKRFIDIHANANNAGSRMLLPMNLGWWAAKAWAGARTEPTFPDDIEYLMAKCLGNDFSFALMGVNPGNIGDIPAYQRLAPIFKNYEDLRLANHFPESVRQQLRVPGEEFTLEQTGDGAWQFRRVQYTKHKVQGIDGWSNVWTTSNPFNELPIQLRIEALMSAAPYDSADGVVLADFADPAGEFSDRACQSGVTASLEASLETVQIGEHSGHFAATNAQTNPKSAWAKVGKPCAPPLNIAGQQALGLWVHGDGQGQLLNLQLHSPHHIARGVGNHYIDVDFEGWRYFELVEPEGERVDNYTWPFGGGYAIYREDVSFGTIDSVALWYNNLPQDTQVQCYVSPIRALPTVPCTLKNPTVTVNGATITFPAEIPSGSYLEFKSLTDCKVYGPKGQLIQHVTPTGQVPSLHQGDNSIDFRCQAPESVSARALVTVISEGPVVE